MKRVNYYKISNTTVSSEIGVWPQLDVPREYYDIPNNFKILQYKEFPECKPNLDGFRLRFGSILTDVLSADMINFSGMFVSSKFKSLVEQAKVQGGRFYKVVLDSEEPPESYGDKLNQYYFFHLIDVGPNLIDYEKSEFRNILKNNQIVKISSHDNYHPTKQPKKLILKYCPDILRRPYSIETLISESFLERIKTESITGLEIEPYTWVEFYEDEK